MPQIKDISTSNNSIPMVFSLFMIIFIKYYNFQIKEEDNDGSWKMEKKEYDRLMQVLSMNGAALLSIQNIKSSDIEVSSVSMETTKSPIQNSQQNEVGKNGEKNESSEGLSTEVIAGIIAVVILVIIVGIIVGLIVFLRVFFHFDFFQYVIFRPEKENSEETFS